MSSPYIASHDKRSAVRCRCRGWWRRMGKTLFSSTVPSFLLGLTYVVSLYIWRSNRDRDHPETIKRRFLSAFCTTLVAPLFVLYFGHEPILAEHGLLKAVGVRREGLFSAVIFPLILTLALFLGPAISFFWDGKCRALSDPSPWIWWRNHVVAPFTEEFAFRACMIPILIGYFGPRNSVLISPLFFGIAHFHHMVERVKLGMDLGTAFLFSSFQFCYTTLFGIYSAYLFVKTGHLAAPVAVHGFCNFMGFPDLNELYHRPAKSRAILFGFYVLGVILFASSFITLTDSSIYHNNVYSW